MKTGKSRKELGAESFEKIKFISYNYERIFYWSFPFIVVLKQREKKRSKAHFFEGVMIKESNI